VTPNQRPTDPRVTVFLLGISTVVAQALLLREAMAAMGGSEMAWGSVMALWLLAMSLGSRIGSGSGSSLLARGLPIVVLVAAAIGVVLFWAAPAVTGSAAGESMTTTSAVWLWIIAVAPSAVAGGIAFPILAGALGAGGGGRAYTLEALGALIGGGLLSLALLGAGTAVALCLALTLVTALTLWSSRRTAAIAVLVLGAVVAPLAADRLAIVGWRWSGHPGSLHEWAETRLQRLEVSDGPPTVLYGDGRLLASYPDPYVILPQAHLAMLLHPAPSRVLAVGCSADGSIEAMVRHPVDELVVVEEDPGLMRRIPRWYGPGMEAVLGAPPVRAVVADPIRAVDRYGPWDMIILRDGNPTTLRHNRTRTREFLARCRANLQPDGVLLLRIAVSDTYLGGAAGRLVTTQAATLREVFEVIEVLAGEEITLVAGGPEANIELDHDLLAGRLRARALQESEFHPAMIPLLVDRDRSRSVLRRIANPEPVNTVSRPRAVILAAGLHEAKSKPHLLRLFLTMDRSRPWPLGALLGIWVIVLLVAAVTKRGPVVTTAATVGFASMGWWLLLIAAWQTTRGSVYSEIGALTAIFMAGLAGGSAFTSRHSSPETRLPLVLVGGGGLSIMLASGVSTALPLAIIPLALLAAGIVTGAAFPGLTALGRAGIRHSAGTAFAAEELGAAFGALTVGIVAIPWAGLRLTALGLGVLLFAAIPGMLVRSRHEEVRG
jgi:spermidine synthase